LIPIRNRLRRVALSDPIDGGTTLRDHGRLLRNRPRVIARVGRIVDVRYFPRIIASCGRRTRRPRAERGLTTKLNRGVDGRDRLISHGLSLDIPVPDLFRRNDDGFDMRLPPVCARKSMMDEWIMAGDSGISGQHAQRIEALLHTRVSSVLAIHNLEDPATAFCNRRTLLARVDGQGEALSIRFSTPLGRNSDKVLRILVSYSNKNADCFGCSPLLLVEP